MKRLKRLLLSVCIIAILALWGFASSVTAQPQVLTYGEPVTATIDETTPRLRYTFEGAVDDMIYVSAYTTIEEGALQVQVFGPNGTSLGMEADNAIGTVVGPITLASGGRYTIEITQPEGYTPISGDFQILVDRAALTAVKPDGRYGGTLAFPGQAVFFAYNGPANELFGYAATGTNIALFMRQPDGTRLLEAFDYGSGQLGNPLNVLPMSGQYITFLQTLNEGGTDYSLRLTPVNVTELKSGDSVSGTLSRENVQVYRFNSKIDELWRVDVSGDMQFNSRLEIRSTDQLDSYVAADQGSGIDGAPRIDPFISGASGDYYILLTTDDPSQVFNYTITLTPSPAVRLDYGVLNSGSVSSDSGAQIFIYFGVADEVIRITLDVTVGSPRLTVYSPGDELVSFMTHSSGKSSFEVTLPQTGLYRFNLDDNSYDRTGLNFTVMLESVR